jgi:sterol desaturase/sphingolipid hydroxylase (fatty acid hydroxylase superfamily)
MAVGRKTGAAPLPGWLKLGLGLGAFALLLALETRRPLRRSVEPKMRRDLRNLAVAAAGAVALRLVEQPLVAPLANAVEARRLGLVKLVRLPAWAETAMGVALMDYTLYLWHILTHRMPVLWRMHVVHHADLDLSASTALRFHFAELAASAPWRAAQVLLIGAGPRTLSLWQALTFVSILFHHSNLRLPARLDRLLTRAIVTPRMHGIHHSDRPEETGSNWSSMLTVWDRLHGTLNLGPPQARLRIGVPAYRDPHELTLGRLLALPFGAQRPTWRPSPPDDRRRAAPRLPG